MASSLHLLGRVAHLQRLRERRQREGTRRRSTDAVPRTILEFVPWASPGWLEPRWLTPFIADVERAFATGDVETYCTVPPRHAKSESILHGIAWGLAHFPETPVLYATHTADFARKQSRHTRKLARIAGVQLEGGSNRADEWETTAGGGLVARGVGGEITGRGFKIIVVDDPFKNRALAEVPTYRERVWEWLHDDVFTRGTPDAAFLVIHTRWTPDDPIGRLKKEGWRGTELRAIAEDDDPLGRKSGEALAPALGWTVEKLEKRQKLVGEYGWASLFQGRPRPRGGKVFNPPTFYREAPKHFTRGYGVDLAYTKRTQADRSVCVEMLSDGEGRYYIPSVLVAQEKAPAFAKRLKIRQAIARAPMLFLCGGVERGAGDFIAEDVPLFEMQVVQTDKFVRALDFAADWNAGRVLVPDPQVFDVDWLPEFLDVLESFTGVSDKRDDEVDAAVAAHKVLARPGVGPLSAYT